MKCSKCGTENESGAKFCKTCGNSLEQRISKPTTIIGNNDNAKTIIITLIAIVVIILIGIGVYASGVFTPDIPLNTLDFGAFKADVPEGSNFVVKDAATNNPKKGAMSYENKGKHDTDLSFILVSYGMDPVEEDNEMELIETDGKMKVYQYKESDSTGKCCVAHVDDGKWQFEAIGYDLNTVKNVAKTFKPIDHTQLTNNATPLTEKTEATSSTASSSSSSTPSSLSILGGSFSTGSADEDKTYARINVGTSHAGEDVIVQIWYSRDGNTLNNGNMVPATVHSDGYLEIASADAYLYYPDYATINIYDSGSNLLDTQSVSLSPSAGTQTF